MIRNVAFAITVLFFASGCYVVQGNGVPGQDERTVPTFDQVQIEDGLEVELVVGERDDAKVIVTGDENVVDYVETQVKAGELKVSLPWGAFDTQSPLKVVVESAFVKELEVNGGSRVNATGLNADQLSVKIDGGSELVASGTCDALDLVVDGGAKALLRDLSSEKASVTLDGGAHAEVLVNQEIEIVAKGGSTLVVAGNPPQQIRVEQSGGAQITVE